jgi:hypothetical protein
MKKLLPILLTTLALPLHAVPVTAEGRAAGDLPNAREIALADALREAVRQGTGLDLLASTEVQNFTLSYDQILGSAFGHIQSYKVLETRLDPDGIYRVRVSAEVEKGTPAAKNSLALRQLLLLRNSPPPRDPHFRPRRPNRLRPFGGIRPRPPNPHRPARHSRRF